MPTPSPPKLTLEELEPRIAPSAVLADSAKGWERVENGFVDGILVPAYSGGYYSASPAFADIDAE